MEEKKEQELVDEQQINQQLENTLLGNESQQQNLYEQNVLDQNIGVQRVQEQSTNEQYNVYEQNNLVEQNVQLNEFEQNKVEENIIGSQNFIGNQEELPVMTAPVDINNNFGQEVESVIPSVNVEEEIPLQTVKTKEKKKSKFWIIILIVVLLLGGIVFLGLRGDPNEITVSFSSEYSKMQLGENIQLSPIIEGNGKDKVDMSTVAWSSSDTSVATVDDNGKVTALAKGTTTITMEVNGVVTTCTVEIIDIVVTGIEITSNITELEKDKTYKLQYKILPDGAVDNSLTWVSSNDKVITVNAGNIKAVGVGTATITVTTTNGKTDTIDIKVPEVLPKSITLNKTSLNLLYGNSDNIRASVGPSNTTNKSVTWSSSNNKVVTVSGGNIKAVGKGSATITAKTVNGLTATCNVTVTVIEDTGVSLDKTSLDLFTGDEVKLNASITPSNASIKALTWSSSNSNVATVNNGKVIAKNVGTTTITVTTVNGNKASCEVKVSPVALNGIVLNKKTVDLLVNNNETLKVTYNPSNATNKNVTWVSSDTSVARVDTNGKVTGVSDGTATITVTSNEGNFTDSCVVNVRSIPVESISISNTSITINTGSTKKIYAYIKPDNATNGTINWVTNNKNIAGIQVDQVNGGLIVTGLSTGTTTITATSSNGLVATCTVNVVFNCDPSKRIDVYTTNSYTAERLIKDYGLNFYQVTSGATCVTGPQIRKFQTARCGVLTTEFSYCKSTRSTYLRIYNW